MRVPPLWSCGLGPLVRINKVFEEGFKEVLRRVHGSARLEIWRIPRWGPYHGGVGGWDAYIPM